MCIPPQLKKKNYTTLGGRLQIITDRRLKGVEDKLHTPFVPSNDSLKTL